MASSDGSGLRYWHGTASLHSGLTNPFFHPSHTSNKNPLVTVTLKTVVHCLLYFLFYFILFYFILFYFCSQSSTCKYSLSQVFLKASGIWSTIHTRTYARLLGLQICFRFSSPLVMTCSQISFCCTRFSLQPSSSWMEEVLGLAYFKHWTSSRPGWQRSWSGYSVVVLD